MSIYNNIKLTAPPTRLNDGSTFPSLDSGSLEQVTTMAPIIGSFRGKLDNSIGAGTYIPLRITPPRSVSTIAGPPSYPYNTIQIKGIVLKEQSSINNNLTLTTGFEILGNLTNPYSPPFSTHFLITTPYQVLPGEQVQFPIVGDNNLHPLPYGGTFNINSPFSEISIVFNNEEIRLQFNKNANREFDNPFFVRGQYLLL